MALAVEDRKATAYAIPQVLPAEPEPEPNAEELLSRPLSNARWEQFAHLVASGMGQAKAYIAAGYSPNGAHQAAHKLASDNADVVRRIAEIQAEIRAKTVNTAALDRAWVLSTLRENAERAMQVEEVRDAKGKPTGEYQWNGNVANRALELIGKELGMFKEQIEVADVTRRLEALKIGRARARQAIEAGDSQDSE